MPDATRLLADGWARTIACALADGPLQPCELEERVGIPRSTLYKRLADFSLLGIVSERRRTMFPLRVEYQLSDSGRTAFCGALLAERQQLRVLPSTINGRSTLGLPEALRLLAPLLRVGPTCAGTCMIVEQRATETHAAWLVAGDRSVAFTATPRRGRADARIEGAPDMWALALMARAPGGLDIRGDQALARALLRAAGSVLRPPIGGIASATRR